MNDNTPSNPEEEQTGTQPTVEAHVESEGRKIKESQFYLRRFIKAFRDFIHHRLSIIDNADPKATIDGIEKDVEFRGFNLWILIFSIIICSIGLNTNSGAVIIGAMLISPLMGPIMGVGLAVGINDVELLRRSLRNWGVAVFMAIFASTVYFIIMPTTGESSELLNRTSPTLLDVLVAIFGGTTGILAGSRREKNNVIPGVAIATALMPPLCTAGYGIATQEWSFFLGAIYLFLINSIFISLATTLVVRYLKFPVRKIPDLAKEKRTRRIILVVLALFILPSVYVFYNVTTRAYYLRKIDIFINEEIHPESAHLIDHELEEDEVGTHTLRLSFIGDKLPTELVSTWNKKLVEHDLMDVNLVVIEAATGELGMDELKNVTDAFITNQNTLEGKNQEITQLRDQLRRIKDAGVPTSLIDEIKIYHPEISDVYAGQLQLSNATQDTIYTMMVKYADNSERSDEELEQMRTRLRQYLTTRLECDTVFISEIK